MSCSKLLITLTLLASGLLAAGQAAAFDHGTPAPLPLKVTQCGIGTVLANAAVTVTIQYANGNPDLPLATEYSDAQGFVTIDVHPIEVGDFVDVAVLPDGETSTMHLSFAYLGPPGPGESEDDDEWDLFPNTGNPPPPFCAPHWHQGTIIIKYKD